MKHSVKHSLSELDRVKVVIEKAYEAYSVKLSSYNPSLEWTGERQATVRFSVMTKVIPVIQRMM